MHEAYEVSHFVTNIGQIETIAAFDNKVLLGTRQGQLYMYSVSPGNDNNQKYEWKIENINRNFSKKPIQQIEVIPENNLLLCLTDSVLSTHKISDVNFPHIKTIEQTKGASSFALDHKPTTSLTGESSSVLRLCVAVRRKLQLYYGKNGEFKQHLFDFTIPDVPKMMAWGQQYLCIGFKAEYVLYDLSTGNPCSLFPISSSRSQEPTIANYSETAFLLGREQTSVFVEEEKDNKFEIKQTFKWKEAPTCVVWDEPYILGLMQDKVMVQTVEPERFIQTLSELNKARLMCRCRRGLIFVASVGQVWCLSLVDVDKQLDQLVKDKQFRTAIDLTVAVFVRDNLTLFSKNSDNHAYHTRHDDKLASLPRTLAKSNKLTHIMGPTIYNNLPNSVTDANSTVSFKFRLKRWLTDKTFYSYKEFIASI